jgi:hypothetical protein
MARIISSENSGSGGSTSSTVSTFHGGEVGPDLSIVFLAPWLGAGQCQLIGAGLDGRVGMSRIPGDKLLDARRALGQAQHQRVRERHAASMTTMLALAGGSWSRPVN